MVDTTTDEAQFIRTICLNPESDDARLIFADWLRDHGQEERGEFIAVQCELSKLKPCKHGWLLERKAKCRYCQLHDIKEWYTHNPEEGREPPKWQPNQWLHFDGMEPLACYAIWERGFISEVRLTCDDFMRHAKAIFERQPVERVVLSDKRPLRASLDEYDWFMDETPRHFGTVESRLPWPLFRQIKLAPNGRWSKSERTEQLALDAVSVACVRYGRKLAGLEKTC